LGLVPFATYQDLFKQRRLPTLFGIGLVVRLPHAAGGLVFTLHVVNTMGMNYFYAGLAATAAAVGWGIGSPWRGRLVDKKGVRRTLIPSTIIEAACWIAMPFLPYWWLLVAALIQGCYMVPGFSLVRQAITVMAPKRLRQAGLSLDAVFTELAFVVGPLLGAAMVTWVGSRPTLVGLGVITVGTGLALILFDPPTRTVTTLGPGASQDPNACAGQGTKTDAGQGTKPLRLTSALLTVLGASAVAAVLFQGVDLTLVRSLNEWHRPGLLGLVAAIWSVGSICGGLIYGALGKRTNPLLMVALMSILTAPAALAGGPVALAAWLALAGVACAPALTSINEALTDLVPEERRTEVFGWSGTAMTVGASVSAPLVGLVLDHQGARAGYLASAAIGLVAGVAGYLIWRRAATATLAPDRLP